MINKLKGHNDKIIYYDNGVPRDVIIDNSNHIIDLVRELVKGTDDSFRLIVTKSTIDNAKKKICVEVNLVNEISVSMNNGKSLSFSKILIMFKNEDGIKKSSSALFYCGKNVYYTPPYINSKGASLAEEIKRICESAIQK